MKNPKIKLMTIFIIPSLFAICLSSCANPQKLNEGSPSEYRINDFELPKLTHGMSRADVHAKLNAPQYTFESEEGAIRDEWVIINPASRLYKRGFIKRALYTVSLGLQRVFEEPHQLGANEEEKIMLAIHYNLDNEVVEIYIN